MSNPQNPNPNNAPYADQARARAEKMRANQADKRPRIAAPIANAAPAPRREVHPDFADRKQDDRWQRWLETEKEPTIREYEEFLQWVNRKAQ